ncbi:MAG: asparagine synthase (glutamine-hydrolyzing) [Candidatus Doudnabacteria bacterium]|nr:asparagine synthase (glutamine-hydrolyzing) [Candidatus Doudnabacteria bacterium]
MCGIEGFNFSDRTAISRMIKLQNHRGPDAHGSFVDDNVSIGNNRLSVIDLSKKGKQPMCNEDGSIWIVFNGEIYNFQPLREELIKTGHRFSSASDTEVLVHGYEEWGESLAEKLNGMWAFAIYDSRKKILFMSRDRFGKKPFFYYYKNGTLIFASEIKAILSHKTVEREINQTALEFYIGLSWIPEPLTIYKYIYKLPKSSYAIFDLKCKKFKKIKKYFSVPNYKQKIHDKKFIIEETRKLIDDSVRLRMMADVPVGSFLSGGLDSSTITATMIKTIGGSDNLHTFSIGFDGKYDESRYALSMADLLETNHHHEYFEKKDFEKLMNKIYFYYDEPFVDPSIYPTYKVSELARRFVTVSLSGDGADELFGGYGHYVNYRRLNVMKKFPSAMKVIGKIFFDKTYRATNSKYALKFLQDFSTILDDKHVPNPTSKNMNMLEKMKSSKAGMLDKALDFDINFTLVDGYLVKVDRASMANSLEVRCPFLDYRLVKFSQKIPSKYKVSLYGTKVLFRKIISDRVPKNITGRKKKMGFTPPVIDWLEKDYKSIAEEKLGELKKTGIVNGKTIDKSLISANKQEMFNLFSLRLWQEKWAEK